MAPAASKSKSEDEGASTPTTVAAAEAPMVEDADGAPGVITPEGQASTEQGQVSSAVGIAGVNPQGQTGGDVKLKTKKVDGSDDLVEVTEDCVEEVHTLNAKRPTYRLIAAKGSLLTKMQVDALQAGGE